MAENTRNFFSPSLPLSVRLAAQPSSLRLLLLVRITVIESGGHPNSNVISSRDPSFYLQRSYFKIGSNSEVLDGQRIWETTIQPTTDGINIGQMSGASWALSPRFLYPLSPFIQMTRGSQIERGIVIGSWFFPILTEGISSTRIHRRCSQDLCSGGKPVVFSLSKTLG